MKINKRLFGKSALAVASAILLVIGSSCTDIWSEDHPGTYYTNNGETIADYLEGRVENHGEFSYFIEILKKAELWGQMRTYGNYTCFAPTDSSLDRYFAQRRAEASTDSMKNIFQSIETVLENRKLCDTIARTHLFNNLMFASDLNGEGVLQHPNMLDRYVTYYSFADSSQLATDLNGNIIKAADGSDSVMIRLKYIINMQATLTHADDTVQNGVVHLIDKVLRSSNSFLPGLLKENSNATIFYQALLATHLSDTLEKYYDDTYPEIEHEWTIDGLRDGSNKHKNETSVETGDNADRVAYPDKREFKFTMFVLPDSLLDNYADDYWTGGIHDLNELRAYAERVYPEGAGMPDTVRESSLNKLLSYHILPCYLSYQQFNTSQKELIQRRLFLKDYDVEDFFETLLPHSIMRISTAYETNEKTYGIFINRKGTVSSPTGLQVEGVKIATANEYEYRGEKPSIICVNGGYHYVNKFVLYNDDTRNNALQCRMRIMCCTLSPDFINSGGRGRLNGDPTNAGIKNIDKMSMAYKLGYCTNFRWVEDQTRFFVRYRDKSFGTFYGDELTVRGSYDLAFKLPAVPTDGNYEIRVWNNSMAGNAAADRGIAQFYFHQYNPAVDESLYWRNWDWIPEDIPVDLRLGGTDARIGMIADNDDRYSSLSDAQKAQEIYQNDRAMRIRGYLKAPDSYTRSGSTDNTGDPIRFDQNCYRKIVCNEYLKANNDYYIRMRQVYEQDGVFPFSFIEIVPKSVYEANEDQH